MANAIPSHLIDYFISILNSYKEGKEIEYTLKGSSEWKDIKKGQWATFDFSNYIYRIKHVVKPKVPWQFIDSKFNYYCVTCCGKGVFLVNKPRYEGGHLVSDGESCFNFILKIPYSGRFEDSIVSRNDTL